MHIKYTLGGVHRDKALEVSRGVLKSPLEKIGIMLLISMSIIIWSSSKLRRRAFPLSYDEGSGVALPQL